MSLLSPCVCAVACCKVFFPATTSISFSVDKSLRFPLGLPEPFLPPVSWISAACIRLFATTCIRVRVSMPSSCTLPRLVKTATHPIQAVQEAQEAREGGARAVRHWLSGALGRCWRSWRGYVAWRAHMRGAGAAVMARMMHRHMAVGGWRGSWVCARSLSGAWSADVCTLWTGAGSQVQKRCDSLVCAVPWSTACVGCLSCMSCLCWAVRRGQPLALCSFVPAQ
jgi:hypothetical protein